MLSAVNTDKQNLFRGSSMVEQAAVNRKVVSSSLTPGANGSADCRKAVCGHFCQNMHGTYEPAGVAELADARDLKSRDPYRSYRFDPGLRHHL